MTQEKELTLELNFEYTEKEMVKARRNWLFLSKTITKAQLFIMGLLGLFVIVEDVLGWENALLIWLGALWGVLMLMYLFIYFVHPIYVYRKTEKYQHPYKLILTEKEIVFETQGISSQMTWDIYDKYLENEEFLYLMQGKHYFTLIPKRVLDSEEKKEVMKNLLENHFK